MTKITLSHGSGGTLMHELIKDLFIKNLDNPYLHNLGDAALIERNLAYTTDSFVINPIFFPGGDIGKLSICGTVNDLAVSGAKPKYISCGMIVEEGFDYKDLEKITLSIKATCKVSGVYIVAGDFKVVEKGAVDKIFINTSGVGKIYTDARLSSNRIKPGDKIIISGTMGDHAAAVLIAREELKFKSKIFSDCAPLNGLIASIISKDIKFMRDPTRGGLATTLNEIAMQCGYNMSIDEKNVPVKENVRVLCEILGLNPLYMANEGKVMLIVSESSASKILSRMKKHPLGRNSRIIGEVGKRKDKKVYLKTKIGGTRIVDMLTGEQLPRIC
ncbi:MAG: hydrogenase expression/formation protein HypE [Candidatus Omnitrophica bacterium]|nr:hydrogenase expression/formation protein HypE [Candidatus Omnitrophota bacterium]